MNGEVPPSSFLFGGGEDMGLKRVTHQGAEKTKSKHRNRAIANPARGNQLFHFARANK